MLTRAQTAALMAVGYSREEVQDGHALRQEEESAEDCIKGGYLPSDRAVRFAWKLLAPLSPTIAEALLA